VKIQFGTDGWRAGVADEYTFDAVRVCAQSVAQWVQKSGQGDRGVVIGFDRRFRSEHFAAAAAGSNGLPLTVLRVLPGSAVLSSVRRCARMRSKSSICDPRTRPRVRCCQKFAE